MTRSHLAHSELRMTMETGLPSVRPNRTPPSSSRASRSIFMRGPRPNPSRRRASSSAMRLVETGMPAGSPSTMTVRAGPCDSPAVRYRITVLAY